MRRVFILLAAAGIALSTCAITDRSAGLVLLEAIDTDDDTTIKLVVVDAWVIGETEEWGTVQISVHDTEVVFTAGDTVELRLYQDDLASDEILWQTSFAITPEELLAGFVDRTFVLTFEAPTDDAGTGVTQVYAEALVLKDACGTFCVDDQPATANLEVRLLS